MLPDSPQRIDLPCLSLPIHFRHTVLGFFKRKRKEGAATVAGYRITTAVVFALPATIRVEWREEREAPGAGVSGRGKVSGFLARPRYVSAGDE